MPANPFAGFSADELVRILAQVAGQLATAEKPEIVTGEIAAVVEGRARRALPVPQWATVTPDGKIQQRGVVIQAWRYKARRLAETKATDRRPESPTLGQIDDWHRTVAEVCAGIVEPADLTPIIVESWGYDVVRYIHQQIERLGPVPPALLAAELAALAGAPPPPVPGPADPSGREPEPPPDDLGDEPVPA